MTLRKLGMIILILGMASCKSLHKNEQAEKWLDSCGPTGVEGWEYCAYKSGPNPRLTLWVFHGMADSVQTVHQSIFKHSGSQDAINALAAKGPIQIITISAGKVWPLKLTGTISIDTVLTKVIPAMEKKFNLKKPYVALGHSQGGFNGLSLCLASDLFSRCALTNPMIVSMQNYEVHKTLSAGNLLEGRFTKEEWFERNPFAQVSRSTKAPQMYLQACVKDFFKLEPDTTALVDLMRARGFNVVYERFESDCSHDEVKAEGLKKFMVGL